MRDYLDPPPFGLAHRGGWRPGGVVDSAAAENTLAAFRAAVADGINHLETDVHAAADGTLIAIHDDRLDRITDMVGAVAELTWPVISRARIAADQPVARLADLLTALPNARLNIDVKAPAAIAPLVKVLIEHKAGNRVCVGSFSASRLAAFRRAAAMAGLDVPTSVGPRGTAALRLLPAGLWRLLRSPGIAYQVPVHHTVLGCRVRVVTPQFVRRAHALGKQVHVWTINDAQEMHRLFDMGVDAIVSDRLDLLTRVLDERRRSQPC